MASSNSALAMACVPREPIVSVVVRCPPLKDYDALFLRRSADELAALLAKEPASPTSLLVRDYRSMRDQCRAIEAKPPGF